MARVAAAPGLAPGVVVDVIDRGTCVPQADVVESYDRAPLPAAQGDHGAPAGAALEVRPIRRAILAKVSLASATRIGRAVATCVLGAVAALRRTALEMVRLATLLARAVRCA